MVSAQVGRPRAKTKARHFLREWRDYRKLSQEALGERLDPPKDRTLISKIERGNVSLTEEAIYEFAHALDIEPGWLWVRPDVIMSQKKVMDALENVPDERKAEIAHAVVTILKVS